MDSHSPYTLTPDQVAQFRRDGCIKLKQVLTPEGIASYVTWLAAQPAT